MNETPDWTPDPLEKLLDASPRPATGEAFREKLFARTANVLRWQRRRRWFGAAAALAACYTAGLGTMHLLTPTPGTRVEIVRIVEEPRLASTPPVVFAGTEDEMPAIVLERLGSLAPEQERALFFRRAGDRYFDVNDLPAAVRCYRQALNVGGPTDRSVSPSDNWLLITLKHAHQKEQRHVANDS